MLSGEASELWAHQPQHVEEGLVPGPDLTDHLSFFHALFIHSLNKHTCKK